MEIIQQNYYTKRILIKYILHNESDMALSNPSVCLSVCPSVRLHVVVQEQQCVHAVRFQPTTQLGQQMACCRKLAF